jgi:hypothetical protein
MGIGPSLREVCQQKDDSIPNEDRDPKYELGWPHQSDDCPPIRPPHCWDAPDAGLVPVFNEGVDRRRKPALVPGGFDV